MERLTVKQMENKYPNRWLGIKDIEYLDEGHREMKSAIVVYTDKTPSELGILALNNDGIQPYYTTPDSSFQLGVLGI